MSLILCGMCFCASMCDKCLYNVVFIIALSGVIFFMVYYDIVFYSISQTIQTVLSPFSSFIYSSKSQSQLPDKDELDGGRPSDSSLRYSLKSIKGDNENLKRSYTEVSFDF